MSRKAIEAEKAKIIARLNQPFRLFEQDAVIEDRKYPRQPQGGVYALLTGRGRVWVESINSIKGTALVRFDAGEGTRSSARTVPIAAIDFGAVAGWKGGQS